MGGAAAEASTKAQQFLQGPPKQLLIGGKWVSAKSGATFEAVNPANEEVLARVAESDKADIDAAVAVLIPFKDENDAVLLGNVTTYGLGAGVWTRDIRRAHRVAHALKAGSVWVNCYGLIDPIAPFGGYKPSGFSRQLGPQSIDLYTQIKSVYMKL